MSDHFYKCNSYAEFISGEWLVFVGVTCCVGFGTLPIYNRQNFFPKRPLGDDFD